MLREAGYAIGNIDITLLAQKPKIAPHTSAMRDRLSEALGIPREYFDKSDYRGGAWLYRKR